MKRFLVAVALVFATVFGVNAQIQADFVVDAGPCSPVIPIFCPGGVEDPQNAVDGDISTAARLHTDIGVLFSEAFLEVGFTFKPKAGSTIGFLVEEANTILNADVIEVITVQIFDTEGELVSEFSNFGLQDLNVLVDDSEARYLSIQTVEGDYEIGSARITLTGIVSVLNDLNVYSVIALETNTNENCGMVNAETIVNSQNAENTNNMVDEDPNNFTLLSIPVSLGQSAFVTVENKVTATAGDFVGFTVEPINEFLNVNLLSNLTLEGFNENDEVVFTKDDFTVADAVALIQGTERYQVGFQIPDAAEYSVTQLRLTYSPIIGVLPDLGIYNAFVAPQFVSGVGITASDSAICRGTTVTLTAEEGFENYLWSNGETTRSITVSAGGNYVVSATIPEKGCKVTGQYRVISEDLLLDFDSVEPTCGGTDGSVVVNVNNGSGDYAYDWSNGSTDSIIENVESSRYVVAVTDNVSGCTASAAVNLNTENAPFFTGAVNHARNGEANGAIYLSILPEDSLNVLWEDGSNQLSRENLAPGVYNVSATNANGCRRIETFFVINEGADLNIAGDETNPDCGASNGSIDVIVLGGSGNYFYNWSNGTVNEDLEDVEAGIYSLIVTDAVSGEQAIAYFGLDEANAPNIQTTEVNEETCSGDGDASISILTVGQIEWSNGANGQNIENLQPGRYSVMVTGLVSGCVSYEVYDIKRRDPLTSTTRSTGVSCEMDTADGTATVIVFGGRMPYNYTWSNGADSSTAVGLEEGTYNVIVDDANGCVILDSVVVKKRTDCDDLYEGVKDDIKVVDDVPAVFTPNGDGINDKWIVVNDPSSFEKLAVKIYNRAGALVYEDETYNNDWEGTYRDSNEDLSEGVYFYNIEAIKNGSKSEINGFVEIVR